MSGFEKKNSLASIQSDFITVISMLGDKDFALMRRVCYVCCLIVRIRYPEFYLLKLQAGPAEAAQNVQALS